MAKEKKKHAVLTTTASEPKEKQDLPLGSAPEAASPPPDPEPVPTGERPLPYKGTVAVALAVLHKAVGVGTADMLKIGRAHV